MYRQYTINTSNFFFLPPEIRNTLSYYFLLFEEIGNLFCKMSEDKLYNVDVVEEWFIMPDGVEIFTKRWKVKYIISIKYIYYYFLLTSLPFFLLLNSPLLNLQLQLLYFYMVLG